MKRNIYTDGNGSSLINIEGMGEYLPRHDVDEIKGKHKKHVSELKDKHKKDLSGVNYLMSTGVTFARNLDAAGIEIKELEAQNESLRKSLSDILSIDKGVFSIDAVDEIFNICREALNND